MKWPTCQYADLKPECCEVPQLASVVQQIHDQTFDVFAEGIDGDNIDESFLASTGGMKWSWPRSNTGGWDKTKPKMLVSKLGDETGDAFAKPKGDATTGVAKGLQFFVDASNADGRVCVVDKFDEDEKQVISLDIDPANGVEDPSGGLTANYGNLNLLAPNGAVMVAGVDSTDFARKSQAETITESWSFGPGNTGKTYDFSGSTLRVPLVDDHNESNSIYMDSGELKFWDEGAFNVHKIWDDQNMGSGSGLDADLLDGHDTSYFAPATAISGTSNRLAKFASSTTIGDSAVDDDGSTWLSTTRAVRLGSLTSSSSAGGIAQWGVGGARITPGNTTTGDGPFRAAYFNSRGVAILRTFGFSQGIFGMTNDAGNDFDQLILGDNTASFPSFVKNGTVIEVKKGDKSGYADLDAGVLKESGTSLASKYQGLDSDLTAIAALTTTAFGRGLLTETNAASVISTLGLAALYQPLDSDLTAIAALTTTAFGRGLLTEANAASARSTLGLGTMATETAANYQLRSEKLGGGSSYLAINGEPADNKILMYLSSEGASEAALGAGTQTLYWDFSTSAPMLKADFGGGRLDLRRYDDTDYVDFYAKAIYQDGSSLASLYQPLDADLTAIAALTTTAAGRSLLALAPGAADKMPYFTSSSASSTTDLTSVARTLIAQTTQANMRSTGLGLGTMAVETASDYAKLADKGNPNGYAELNGDGYVPTDQLGAGTPDSHTYLNGEFTWKKPIGVMVAMAAGNFLR